MLLWLWVLCLIILSLLTFFCCLQFILLGAVPFPSDVPRLKELGVCGVITLNEPYETLVPSSLYKVCYRTKNLLVLCLLVSCYLLTFV